MKIAIIGPGALGCYFAARMCQWGAHTTLVDYKPDRAQRLAAAGVVVESNTERVSAHPELATVMPESQDLVIVLTKATSTASLRIPPGQPVLTLQNGLGNAEALADTVGADWVLAGSTSQGCTLIGEGRVYHAAEGPLLFGPWTTCPADEAAMALRGAGFQVQLTDNPAEVIWEKAIASAGINPLTAILGVQNGGLIESEAARSLLRDLVTEAESAAVSEGFQITRDAIQSVESICRLTAGNVSSMLQDIRAGRLTEIEAITGEILRRGGRASLPLPRSRTVYRLVKALEAQHETAGDGNV